MARTKKRKAATVAGVSVLTAALLLGGTFAWQSISQTALNENHASVNPGARLHDDYSGNYSKSGAKAVTDVGVKRVYVENFTDEEDKVAIIARVRLDEYMEIGASAGYKSTTVTAYENTVISKLDADGLAHGIVEVEEDTSVSGQVTLKVTPVPYTGYTVKSVKVDSSTDVTNSMSGGVYTHTAQTITDGKITPVTIEVEFETDNSTPYAYDTIEPAKSLVAQDTNGDAVTINDSGNWKTYVPKVNASSGKLEEDTASAFRNYVTLNFGWDSSYDTTGIYYMPTFNKDKDSLKADINGTYAEGFSDYKDYADPANQTVKAYASYDDDENDVDDGNIYKKEETHTAAAIDKTKSKVISMAQWKDDYKMAPGDYWVYDTDGWAYWANLLEPETATGLFLSRNEMTGTPEDNWYYGMNVVGQFVTSEDIGSDTEAIGFYTNANEKPSNDAKTLLGILTKLNDAQTTSLESGQKLDVTYLKNEAQAVQASSLEALDGTWVVSDESVVELSKVESDTKVVATAKKPGNAIITYIASNGNVALAKVTVDYATYTVSTVADGVAKGIITYTDDERTQVKIAGYYTDGDICYQVAVGERLYYNNQNITGLELGEGISSIADMAFTSCKKLESVLKIPGSVKMIGMAAFQNCEKVEGLILEEGILNINTNAFIGLQNVSGNLEIPASVVQLGDAGAFQMSKFESFTVAEGNKNYCAENGVLYTIDKKILESYPCGSAATNFEIPSGVEVLRSFSFRGANNLTKVTIPETVVEIQNGVFLSCAELSEVTLPASATKVHGNSWCGTPKLNKIQVAEGNEVYTVINGMLYSKDGTTLLGCPGGITEPVIADGTKKIDYRAFWGSKLTSIVIPNTLTEVGTQPFMEVNNLENVYYKGSEAEWNASPLKDISCLANAQITFDYPNE